MKKNIAKRLYLGMALTVLSLGVWQFLIVPISDTMADSGYYREDRAHHWPHGWAGGLEVDKRNHLPEGTTYRSWKRHRMAQEALQTKQRLAKQAAALSHADGSAAGEKL